MGRKDGKRVKNVEAMYLVAPYIMRERNDAQNMIHLDIPIDPLNKYIRSKHDQERVNISHLAIVIAAYLRTCAEYRELNHFVVNKKIYKYNEFTCGMVVLKPGDNEGTMNKMHLGYMDTLMEVQAKLDAYIMQNRQSGETNSTDKLIKFLLSIPGLVNFGTSLLIWMDKHNLLPKSIIDASPFHCTMSITNLASIRTNYIYHHCYNFGTTSVFIAMGNVREVPTRSILGVKTVRCIPLGVTMDERIASGSYFAAAFKRFKAYLADPTLLEQPPQFELFSK